MEAVREAGIEANTLIVFTADNGCSPSANYKNLKAHGHNPSYIFRGTKADIYDGGHRVPYIMRYPALIAPGSQSDAPVCQTGLMATCAELLGFKAPADYDKLEQGDTVAIYDAPDSVKCRKFTLVVENKNTDIPLRLECGERQQNMLLCGGSLRMASGND